MTVCMEKVSEILECYYPNQVIQGLFLQVHSSYFHNCTKEEVLLEDAPQWLVITLTLIPVSLIPILTYLVVWKSKVQEWDLLDLHHHNYAKENIVNEWKKES